MEKIPIIAVVGPTASGKTELAVKLAEKIEGEIISFDSMQIYKEMHVASAAPDLAEQRGIPHHLLEFLSPESSFSVADFVKLARETVKDIHSRGKRVIIAGGTGLYVNSFLDNLTFSEEEIDMKLREELNRRFDEVGGQAMLDELRGFDSESAERLHPNNKKRIIRAFEIYKTTGQTMSEQLKKSRIAPSPYEPYMLGLNFFSRELLYERIGLRVDKMLEAGLLEEAKAAFLNSKKRTSAQAIGHKEFFGFFRGETTLPEATELLKAETRRYAKRQLTWFRRDERINWIYRDQTEDVLGEALKILERMGYFGTQA